jgi:hypothetical protein
VTGQASCRARPSGDAFFVRDWSRACEVLLGWSAAQAAGQSISGGAQRGAGQGKGVEFTVGLPWQRPEPLPPAPVEAGLQPSLRRLDSATSPCAVENNGSAPGP